LTSTAQAEIGTLTVEPPEPMTGQDVTLTAGGYLPSTCWWFIESRCGDSVQPEIVIEVFTYDCTDRECVTCYWSSTPFSSPCVYSFTHPGTYTVRLIEHRDSLIYPETLVETFQFEVTGPVLGGEETWARIKQVYR